MKTLGQALGPFWAPAAVTALLGPETSWKSFSSHLSEASKELKICLQGLICSQALPPEIPTLCFPQHSPFRAALGSGVPPLSSPYYRARGTWGFCYPHQPESWLTAIRCVLGSFFPFLNLSIHQPDDTLETEVSWKSCSPLCPGNGAEPRGWRPPCLLGPALLEG